MGSERFERRVRIEARRGRVHAELSEPARQLGLQPLLEEIRELPPPGPGLRAFLAVERVPLLGPLRLRNRIRVELDATDPARVLFRARSPGGVGVASEFHLAGVGEATEVTERVDVHVPAWLGLLRGFILRQAVAAQERLLENLKARIEDGG